MRLADNAGFHEKKRRLSIEVNFLKLTTDEKRKRTKTYCSISVAAW